MKNCPTCNASFPDKGLATHIWRKHGEGQTYRSNTAGLKRGDNAWNKGLSKDNSVSMAKIAAIMKLVTKGIASTPEKEKLRKQRISTTMRQRGHGGLRKGSGVGRKGWYRGIWCDSSWELAFVIWNLDHLISVKRNIDKFAYTDEDGQVHMYVPDFIMPDGTYVEIKGYITNRVILKMQQFPHSLSLIDKSSIVPYLTYTITKYGKNFVQQYTTEK